MTNSVEDRVISAFTAANQASANDLIIIAINPNTAFAGNRKLTFGNLFGNVAWPIAGSFSINTSNNIAANNIIIVNSNTPANSTALTVTDRRIWWDADFIYVVTANNTVKRAALSTF